MGCGVPRGREAPRRAAMCGHGQRVFISPSCSSGEGLSLMFEMGWFERRISCSALNASNPYRAAPTKTNIQARHCRTGTAWQFWRRSFRHPFQHTADLGPALIRRRHGSGLPAVPSGAVNICRVAQARDGYTGPFQCRFRPCDFGCECHGRKSTHMRGWLASTKRC
jgi:hypothetical protein